MYLPCPAWLPAEGYPEVGDHYYKAGLEKPSMPKFQEMLGEVVTDSTKKNLQMRGRGRTATGQRGYKVAIAKRAKGSSTGRYPRHRP